MDRFFEWPPSQELDIPESYVGVMIERLPEGGWHTGVLYRTRQGGAYVLHLKGHGRGIHRRFIHESPRSGQLCVLCPVEEVEVQAPRNVFLKIYSENDNRGLPYGFSPPLGEWFGADGRLILGPPGRGLCCQTFVLAAYEAADLRLIDPPEAPSRPDDQERQRGIFERIAERLNETSPPTREHFAVVEANLGTALYRPLEVAGAAKAGALPCSLAEAQANGNELEPLVPIPAAVVVIPVEVAPEVPAISLPEPPVAED